MHSKIQLLKDNNKNPELVAFDELPKELRDKINYTEDRLDPRQILGIYRQQGIHSALSFLEDIATAQGSE